MNRATALATFAYRARLHGPDREAWASCEAEKLLLRERYEYVRGFVRAELEAVHELRKVHPMAEIPTAKREEVSRLIALEDRIFRFI